VVETPAFRATERGHPIGSRAVTAPVPRRLRVLAAGAAGVALLTRAPFVAHALWDHDSVQFALAVERFDLAAHQPHPPGYPLYIGLLKTLAAAGVGPLAGMLVLSVLAAMVGAAAMAGLAHHLVGGGESGERTALLAAALYVFNPLLWFYGELPLVYAVEGGVAVAVAWAVARMPESRRRFLAACALLALAGGLRPSTLVLLSPLLLWGVIATRQRGRLSAGLFAGGAVLGAAVVLAWLIPLLVAAGGLAAYRRISAAHFGALLPRTSVLYGAGLEALGHNVLLIFKWAVQGLVPGALALLVLWLLAPAAVLPEWRRLVSRAGFLAAWALPPMVFFALFHITKAGYTLIYLPALLTALAVLAAPALESPAEPGRGPVRNPWARVWAGVLLVAVTGSSLFLLGETRDEGSPRWLALVRHEFNLREIRSFERDFEEALAVLRTFPPSSTVFASVELTGRGAAGSEGFLYPWHRHLQWYLPDSPVVYLVPELELAERCPGGHRPFRPVPWTNWVPADARRVVWVLSGAPDDRFELPPGEDLLVNPRFWIRVTEPPALQERRPRCARQSPSWRSWPFSPNANASSSSWIRRSTFLSGTSRLRVTRAGAKLSTAWTPASASAS
jgi:hypothetical protein